MYFIVWERIALEAIVDIFYFPLWWYTFGVWRIGRWSIGLLARGNRILSPGLWLKNLFVPMYGQYDWEGRTISFIVRLVEVVIRLFLLILWLLVCFLFWLFWLALPLALGFLYYKTVFVSGRNLTTAK